MIARDLDERDDIIRKLREKGASLREISDATGLSEGGVSYRIRRQGLPLKYINERNVSLDERLADLVASGCTLADIIRATDIGSKAIRIKLDRLGLAPVNKISGHYITDADESFLTDFRSGLSKSAISRKHKVSWSRVDKSLRKLHRLGK